MKLKKWGALLLALYMIVTVLPTTAMASENPVAGPDAEKYEFALLDYGEEYSPDKELSGISVNVNDRNEYYLYLVNTNADGTKTPVDTDLYDLACELPNGAQNALVKAYQDDDFYRVSVIGINEASENLTLKATLTETSESVTETAALEVNDTGSYPDFSLAVYGIEFNYHPGHALQNLETETPYQVSVAGIRDDGSFFVLDTSLYTIDIQIAKGNTYAFGSELHQLDDGYYFDISGTGDTREYDSVVVHAEGAFGSADLTCPINVKAIENDFVVQLPSADEMIGTSPDWLAVTSEPAWDGTILDVVNVAQRFYDSTGKEMTETDTFQNNSRYMMKMTFQSFESYHGDYYYVLSGKNNVYVQYMNGTGEREPMKVTVNKDENGNPVITATYSFSIGTPPEEPVNAYECSIYNMNTNEYQTGETAKMDVVIGETTQYRVKLFTTDPNGFKEDVTTDSMLLEYTTVKDLSQYVDISVETEYNSYVVSLTGKQMLNDYSGCNFLFNNIKGNTLLGEADVTFNFIEPTDITLNKTYKLSDQTWQTLYYRYQPEPNGSQYYTLRTNNVRDCTPNDGHGKYSIYKSTDKNPIIFMLSRLTMDEECEFELVKYKLPTEIKILPIPDSIIEDIEKNGKEADLNGIKFTVTYDDGSTYTHELNGERMTISEGDNSFVQYEMDCWDLDKNIYRCIPELENNSITIYSGTVLNTSDGSYIPASDKITFSVRQKVNITKGLSEVPGDLGDTEYNTVEKIEDKLTETIVSNEGYSADNTVLYDIEFVTSEDGGKTWIPVTAENFPEEGIDVTLPYPEGTNAADYDFTVVHMFDEDVNGHKAGEVETPEATEGENGISFRLMGTSPVMVGYKKAAVPHTHSYGKWTDCKDGSNHQRSCACGDVQKEAHVWDDGKVTKEATKDAEGIKTYTCKTCGATKTVSIPKLTSDTTPSKPGDSANPNTDTTSPETGDSANIALWIIVMLASAAGLSSTYFVRRKNKI